MKKLRLTFLNADGTKKNITLQHVAQDLTPEAVYTAMLRLCELEIFEKNGIKLMVQPIRACYVDKEVTELFTVTTDESGEDILVINPKYADCEIEAETFGLIVKLKEWFKSAGQVVDFVSEAVKIQQLYFSAPSNRRVLLC